MDDKIQWKKSSTLSDSHRINKYTQNCFVCHINDYSMEQIKISKYLMRKIFVVARKYDAFQLVHLIRVFGWFYPDRARSVSLSVIDGASLSSSSFRLIRWPEKLNDLKRIFLSNCCQAHAWRWIQYWMPNTYNEAINMLSAIICSPLLVWHL